MSLDLEFLEAHVLSPCEMDVNAMRLFETVGLFRSGHMPFNQVWCRNFLRRAGSTARSQSRISKVFWVL